MDFFPFFKASAEEHICENRLNSMSSCTVCSSLKPAGAL